MSQGPADPQSSDSPPPDPERLRFPFGESLPSESGEPSQRAAGEAIDAERLRFPFGETISQGDPLTKVEGLAESGAKTQAEPQRESFNEEDATTALVDRLYQEAMELDSSPDASSPESLLAGPGRSASYVGDPRARDSINDPIVIDFDGSSDDAPIFSDSGLEVPAELKARLGNSASYTGDPAARDSLDDPIVVDFEDGPETRGSMRFRPAILDDDEPAPRRAGRSFPADSLSQSDEDLLEASAELRLSDLDEPVPGVDELDSASSLSTLSRDSRESLDSGESIRAGDANLSSERSGQIIAPMDGLELRGELARLQRELREQRRLNSELLASQGRQRVLFFVVLVLALLGLVVAIIVLRARPDAPPLEPQIAALRAELLQIRRKLQQSESSLGLTEAELLRAREAREEVLREATKSQEERAAALAEKSAIEVELSALRDREAEGRDFAARLDESKQELAEQGRALAEAKARLAEAEAQAARRADERRRLEEARREAEAQIAALQRQLDDGKGDSEKDSEAATAEARGEAESLAALSAGRGQGATGSGSGSGSGAEDGWGASDDDGWGEGGSDDGWGEGGSDDGWGEGGKDGWGEESAELTPHKPLLSEVWDWARENIHGSLSYKNFTHFDGRDEFGRRFRLTRHELRGALEYKGPLVSLLSLYAEIDWRVDDDDYAKEPVQNLRNDSLRRAVVNFDELYILAPLGDLDLRLGYQTIAWGTGDLQNPTDNINSRDISDLFDGKKLGVLALRANYYLADFNFEGVVVPFFTPARVPITDKRFSPALQIAPIPVGPVTVTPDLALERELPEDKEAAQFGARVSRSFLGWDVSASFYDGYNKVPLAKIEAFETAPVAPGVPGLLLRSTLFYERIRVYGADFATTLAWLSHDGELGNIARKTQIHGEVAYVDSRDDTGDDYLQYVLGLNYTFNDLILDHDLTVLVDYLDEVMIEPRKRFGVESLINGLSPALQSLAQPFLPLASAFVRERADLARGFRGSISARLSYAFSDTLELVVTGVLVVRGRENAFIQSKLVWDVTDNFRFEAGLDLLEGPRDTFFGQYRENDRVFFVTRLNF